MPEVTFAPHFRRYVSGLPDQIEGRTVAEVLETACRTVSSLRSYIFDDRGALRKHINVFVDDVLVDRDAALDHALARDSHVYVLQALSGG